MRKLWRPDVHPPTVSANGKKGYEYACAQQRNTVDRRVFKPHWTESDVRGCVRATCGYACAYCGDRVGRTGEDVEHFRPKSPYWFLAYSFDNYLASCRQCNSSRKGNRFAVETGHPRATSRDQVVAERRLLLDPVLDSVEDAMHIVKEEGGRYLWQVNPAAAPDMRRRAEYTIEFFALNTDVELVRARSQAIASHLFDTLERDDEARNLVRQNASRYVEHGSAIRSILAQQESKYLPTPVEEVGWLVARLVETVQAYDGMANPDRRSRMLCCYALAALLVSPPAGVTPLDVRGWIPDDGLLAEVTALAGELGNAPLPCPP